jgi:hypothetical protein
MSVTDYSNNGIRQVLQRQAAKLDPRKLFITPVAGAADLITTDPYAFALASSLARGRDDEVAWTVPYDIHQELGHLDARLIHRIPLQVLQQLFFQLAPRLFYVTGAPLTVTDLTDEITGPCNGDASRLWRGRTAAQVQDRFAGFHGAPARDPDVLILRLEHIYGIRFPDRSQGRPIIHRTTERVLLRLGLALDETPTAAEEAITRLYDGYPAAIDVPLWYVGRWWCRTWRPACVECFLADHCPRIGVQSID